MEAARAGWDSALAAVAMRDSGIPVYANLTGLPGSQAILGRGLLAEQMTSPVRWTETIRHIAADYPGITYIEMGPGHVLSGLIRKIDPTATVLPAGTAANVDAILEHQAA